MNYFSRTLIIYLLSLRQFRLTKRSLLRLTYIRGLIPESGRDFSIGLISCNNQTGDVASVVVCCFVSYFIEAPIILWGFCVWSLFCYTVLNALYSFALILIGNRKKYPTWVIKALRVLVGTAALKRSNREVVS